MWAKMMNQEEGESEEDILWNMMQAKEKEPSEASNKELEEERRAGESGLRIQEMKQVTGRTQSAAAQDAVRIL